MRKIVRYLMLLVVLFGAMALPAQAQEETRVEQGVAFLAANHIPVAAYDDLSAALNTNDHRNVAAVLAQYGYSPEQLAAFLTDMNLLLLSNAIQPQPSDSIQVRALALLQSYGLNGLDLQTLAPLATDQAALMDALLQKGLTDEQAAQLLGQLAVLLEEGAAQGLLPYYMINARTFGIITGAGLSRAILYDSAHLLSDPAAVAAHLAGLGFSAVQIQTFITLLPELAGLGVTADAIEGWTIRSMIYRLEGIGLSPQSIYVVVSLGNLDAVRGYLTANGLGGDTLELALIHIGDCMGTRGEALSPERLQAYQTREARTLLDSAGIAQADLGIIVSLRGYPASLSAFLAEAYGLDEAQIARFVTGLNQTTFARTLDPDGAGAYLGDVFEAPAP